MSDSGRWTGECEHGNLKGRCDKCRLAELEQTIASLREGQEFSQQAGIPHQRAWDLLRQMRSELHEANLISNEEYAWLAFRQYDKDWTKPGQGSKAPRRLERYDEHAARLKQAEAQVQQLTESQIRLREALQEADRWFDGWCPTATCCAHTGGQVHEQIKNAVLVSGGGERT